MPDPASELHDIDLEPASTFSVPAISDVNAERLRAERLGRLRAAMRERGVAACLLFEPANVRYATGTSVMATWSAMASVRYCVVAMDGLVLFEQDVGLAQASALVPDVRPATWWQWHGARSDLLVERFADGVTEALRDLGVDGEPLAVDRIEMAGVLALQKRGVGLIPAGQIADAAREVKTPEEVKLLTINGAIGDAMLTEFEEAIRPGIREYELFAVLSDALLRRQGELIFTRLVASGRNTNPWGSEARDKMVMPGDLVGVDTDALGYEGYLIDVSRTFHCGTRPTREQVELYRIASECVTAMREVAKPGISYLEFAEQVPALPDRFHAQRYELLVHGAGLEDEGPIIYHPDQGLNPDDVYLQENMSLCFECYVGAPGGAFGVKLEDQVLLTAHGAELLSTFPHDAKLLGIG
jgi:Xaa-Pro aminopeptidase